MNKKFVFKRNYIMIIILIMFICLLANMLSISSAYLIRLDKPADFSQGWDISRDEATNIIEYTRPITSDMAGKTIEFYTVDSAVEAFIDNVSFFEFKAPSLITKSPGSARQFIRIPENSLGKSLSIQIHCIYSGHMDDQFSFSIGEYGSVLLQELVNELPQLFMGFFILLLGIGLIIMFFVEKSRKVLDKRVLFLGLFSIFLIIGSTCDLFAMQMFLPYGLPPYFTYFFAMFALPEFLICYLEEMSQKTKLTVQFYIHLTVVAVLTILQFLGIAEFGETSTAYSIIVCIEIITAIIHVIAKGIKLSTRIIVGLIILGVSIISNTVLAMFFTSKFNSLTISELGFTIYLCIAISEYFSSFLTRSIAVKNAELLKRQAYTDHLTDLGNRYAFAEAVAGADLRNMSIVSFDVNNLKYYNDKYGHMYGDRLILATAKILSRVYGAVYRIGGDEFAAVLTCVSPEKLEELKTKLAAVSEKSSNSDLVIKIACGYSSYEESDLSYEDILKRADEKMYEHKAELKKN